MTRVASFPIPVLGSRDDVAGELAVDHCSVEVDDGRVEIKLRLLMDNPGIAARIDSGSAAFALRLSCQRTFFRKTWVSSVPEFTVQLEQHEVSGRIQLHPTVIATDSMTGYRPTGLNADYGDTTFGVRRGQVLAIARSHSANLDTSFDPLRNLDASIIRIGKDEDLTGSFRIDCESDQILLFIDKSSWGKYQSVKTRVPHTIMMSLVVPVVAEAIHQMRRSDADDAYGNFKWYQRMKQVIDVRPHLQIDTGSPLQIAQELLSSPHQKGLAELDSELFRENDE